ncbi:hypothetical protein PLESTB_000208700 [Pleodorina starrii]|uniref:Protein kinase domain-containing protein n=1 Tax=Pleodorina starrii TaxID=330485 RepID=A0A9W6BD33_9CHLO|nr:hypothetical protein PLESTB_000208700 [Pleodorina starrii]
MVFACCFGGGGGDVDVQRKTISYGDSVEQRAIIGKTGKGQDFSELPTTNTGATFISGNTASLSAVTSTDNSSVAYQLNILSSALAGLSGNWYERVSSAATRLVNVSDAALCSISILDSGHNKFTVVHVTGKDPECASICPIGSQLPALQAVSSSTHHQPMGTGVPELRYNSVQVLQLLQTPLLYSFSDPIHGSREMKQPPYDWQAVYGNRGLSDFCALPLVHEKSVVGAVTLIFGPPSPPPPPPMAGRPPPPPPLLGPGGGAGGRLAAGMGVHHLVCCDEQSMRTLGLLLSVLLTGQDLRLAQQIGEILAGVHGAQNLQQVMKALSSGAECVLQLRTQVAVTVTLAVLPGAVTAAAAAGGGGGGVGLLSAGVSSVGGGNDSVSAGGGGGGTSLHAIFFEERGAAAGGDGGGGGGCSGSGAGAMSRSLPSAGEVMQQAAAQGLGGRGRTQRANTPVEMHGGGGGGGGASGAGIHGVLPPGLGRSGGGPGTAPPVLRVGASGTSSSADGLLAAHGSLLWQASSVQARALGLRHTLLANLPGSGTIVHDCASYIQQVGSPKRDLYLLSACNGAPPYSLAIAPAPLQLLPRTGGGGDAAAAGGGGGGAQLVLYVAVAMRLPLELLGEILAQAQQLAVRVLAPLLGQKLAQGGLANEWALLLGKCAARRGGGGTGGGGGGGGGDVTVAAGATATEPPSPVRASNSAIGLVTGGGHGGGTTAAAAAAAAASATASAAGGAASTAGDAAAAEAGSSPTAAATAPAHDGACAAAAGSAAPPPSSSALSCTGGVPPPAAAAPPPPAAGGASATGGTGAASHGLSAVDTSRDSQATVLSTAIAGAFAGDTRTHMGMLVSSFKDTINALQAFRADEAEELSVLKLGKVLGRGGSGLVFQGYLHMGLEVAVKLFENPDDTDTDTVTSENGARTLNFDGSSVGPSADAAAAAAECAGSQSPAAAVKDAAGGGGGAAAAGGGAVRQTSLRTSAAAQMTKRQRDLLRNALELGVTSSLSHPNIVQGYCHWVNVVLMQDASLNRCWLMGQAEYTALAPPGTPPPPLCSALVMEYCDMGSLIHALKRGTFAAPDGKPNMEYVYMCLLEIALALRHLHTAKLAHCDLKPGNVLLRSSPRDPRGFVCKLGDFGYAAILKDGLLPGRPAVLPEEACGTLQYMAPELFVAGRPVDASIDVYAFGMLMWELITGRTPYSESEYPSRSLMKAVYHGKRPAFPENTPQSYKNLAMCCWNGESNLRPGASVLVRLLRQQLESIKQHTSTASSTSTAGGGGGGS